ncbi:MAG: ThuA domain-containing protein [Candidatus Brocadiia bacterium]
MNRRDMLRAAGLLGASVLGLRRAASAPRKPQKLLYFTRNVGYYHSVVRRKGEELSHSEKGLVELGKEHDIEVKCTKDGRVFDGDIEQFDAIAFYCNGNLTKPNKQGEPPMTPKGVKHLMDAIAAGKGLVGLHSTCNCWGTAGPRQDGVDPFIHMFGAGFVSHGPQQVATMEVASPDFPGMKGLGESFQLREEWYAMKDFARDLHVVLVQQTEGMKGGCYQRPPFPSTWARMHGEGRVFFTSMAHREDVWSGQPFQQVLLGGLAWVLGRAEADVSPNITEVTPKAWELKK